MPRQHFFDEPVAALIRRRRYPYDLQRVDLGIAMFHFAATAGLPGRWENRPPAAVDAPGNVEYVVSWAPG